MPIWDAIVGAFYRGRRRPSRKISAAFRFSGEAIDSPAKVVVSYPYAENYQLNNVARVVVFGGNRSVPFWNAQADTEYDKPTGAVVTTIDGKARQFPKAGKFGDMDMVYVTGGTRLFDVSVSGDGACSPSFTGDDYADGYTDGACLLAPRPACSADYDRGFSDGVQTRKVRQSMPDEVSGDVLSYVNDADADAEALKKLAR